MAIHIFRRTSNVE